LPSFVFTKDPMNFLMSSFRFRIAKAAADIWE